MRLTYVLVALEACYEAQASSASTTITCSSCHPASSTPDVVTRSDAPVPSCTAPALTAAYHSSMSGSPSTSGMPSGTGVMPTGTGATGPSDVPVSGASSLSGRLSAVAAAAMAVVYLM